MNGFDYKLEYLFSYGASGGARPQIIGPTAEGIRAIFPIAGGEVDGPRLRGKVLPGGGDWLSLRTDGVAVLDVRITLESHDGALIYVSYGGVGDFGADGYAKFLKGELPPTLRIRATPRFQTGDPRYAWLNRLQCLAIGEADFTRPRIAYDLYAVN